MSMVPFYDVRAVNARFEKEFAAALARVNGSGWYLRGEETRKFEDLFGQFLGVQHVVGVASGLDALRLILEAWKLLGKLKPGDEVVVPANSFIASALAVTHAGLVVRFADVSPDTFNLTPEGIERVRSDRTRVVLLVHLYGNAQDARAVQVRCAELGLLLLEDAAQAHGAEVLDVRAGAIGDAGAFSFYPTKNLGALGDAGCVVTQDSETAETVRMLGNYGSREKYLHAFAGYNSRIDELSAAFLSIKLRVLDQDNVRRRAIAYQYATEIRNSAILLPRLPQHPAAHVWHLFVVRTEFRRQLILHLDAHGVDVLVHYPCPIHLQEAYRDEAGLRTACPISEALSRSVLSLPMSPVLAQEQVERVINAVNVWKAPDGS